MLVKGRKVVEVLPRVDKEEARRVEGLIILTETRLGQVELRRKVRDPVKKGTMSYIDMFIEDEFIGSLKVCNVQGITRVLIGADNRIDSIQEDLRIGIDRDLISSQLDVLRWEIDEDKVNYVIDEVLCIMEGSRELDCQSWNCRRMWDYLREECHREDLLLDWTTSLWTEIKRRWKMIEDGDLSN